MVKVDKIERLVTKLLKIFKIKVSNKTKKILVQIFKFAIVGVVATLIDFLFLYIFREFFKFPVVLANTLSFVISVIYNYTASVKWVFDVNKEKSEKKQFITFIIFSVIGLLINDLIMWISVDQLNIYYLLAKIIATLIVMVFNFVSRKIFLE